MIDLNKTNQVSQTVLSMYNNTGTSIMHQFIPNIYTNNTITISSTASSGSGIVLTPQIIDESENGWIIKDLLDIICNKIVVKFPELFLGGIMPHAIFDGECYNLTITDFNGGYVFCTYNMADMQFRITNFSTGYIDIFNLSDPLFNPEADLFNIVSKHIENSKLSKQFEDSKLKKYETYASDNTAGILYGNTYFW